MCNNNYYCAQLFDKTISKCKMHSYGSKLVYIELDFGQVFVGALPGTVIVVEAAVSSFELLDKTINVTPSIHLRRLYTERDH